MQLRFMVLMHARSVRGLSMNRTMPCLQMNKLYILGSWSQCIRKSERGLSMNRTMPPLQMNKLRILRFMVPMHAKKRMGARHEPTHARPLRGGEQALVRALSVPLLGGVRGGFMVPMHSEKTKGGSP